jgi:hypothetical protein
VEKLVCRRCGVIQLVSEAKVSVNKIKDGRIQIRADCSDCGSWIKWLTQTPELLDMLGIEKPKNEFEMDFDTPSVNEVIIDPVKNKDNDLDFGTIGNDIKPSDSNDDCPFDF